jgi:hypothetical protein
MFIFFPLAFLYFIKDYVSYSHIFFVFITDLNSRVEHWWAYSYAIFIFVLIKDTPLIAKYLD